MPFSDDLLQRIRQSRRVLLTGPESPDGDSIGACLALQRALAVVASGVHVEVAGEPGFRYRWLAGAEAMIADDAVAADYDGVVILDGDAKRLMKPVARAFSAAGWTGLIDHHRSTDTGGYTICWLDPKVESTCVMVRELFAAWGVALDREVATQLYTGLIFDTGAFRYSNARPSSHVLAAELLGHGIEHHRVCERVLMDRRLPGLKLYARVLDTARFLAGDRVAVGVYPKELRDALGCADGDAEGLVDGLQHVQGVEIAALFIEKEPGKTKLSLRSRGGVDVAALATQISDRGGGHAKAAGAALDLPLEQAIAKVEPMLIAAIGGTGSPPGPVGGSEATGALVGWVQSDAENRGAR